MRETTAKHLSPQIHSFRKKLTLEKRSQTVKIQANDFKFSDTIANICHIYSLNSLVDSFFNMSQ